MSGIQLDPLTAIASLPDHYERSRAWKYKGNESAANRRTIVSPDYFTVNINNVGYVKKTAVELDLNVGTSWDTTVGTDYSTAANRAGKDFYVYACVPASGSVPTILLSAATTYPSGYSATTSRKVAGFHCLPGNCTGLAVGHPYKDFILGDVLFNSIWDILDRPTCSPEGMAKVSLTPSDGKPAIWCDIYLASGNGTVCTSVFGATIADTIDWNAFVEYGRLQGKRLLRDAEFQNAATGSNEETNITGSADPGTVTFPLDTSNVSMISSYGIIGMCGIMWQWLDEQCYRFDPDGSSAAANKTITIYHVVSPGGNPIYVKFLANGEPYLCCNMATDTVDKWLTIGTDYKVLITHDANAATNSTQIYFDEDATQPGRIVANLARGKTCFVTSNNPTYALQITHSGTASSLGVVITYDDGSDERLEFTSPTTTNGTLDLALLGSSAYVWYNLPGTVGSFYGQSIGDTKLIAGGTWADGSSCGSRSRAASAQRSAVTSGIGARFASGGI